MENYIAISKLNDFNYNPKSLFFSSCYTQFERSTYDDTPQVAGRYAHDNIQSQFASKYLFLDKYVIEQNLGIFGKIDIFDIKKKLLIERKNKIKKMFIGYQLQLYAQYFCLKSMGFKIDKIMLYSIKDKKEYYFDLPDESIYFLLLEIAERIRSYNIKDLINISDHNTKDPNTIYKNLFF